jgi:serine/threonine protein kinase
MKVETENIVFPEGISESAKDFIDKLIRKDPTQRIRTSEALLHPFLREQEDEG